MHFMGKNNQEDCIDIRVYEIRSLQTLQNYSKCSVESLCCFSFREKLQIRVRKYTSTI